MKGALGIVVWDMAKRLRRYLRMRRDLGPYLLTGRRYIEYSGGSRIGTIASDLCVESNYTFCPKDTKTKETHLTRARIPLHARDRFVVILIPLETSASSIFN